MGWKQEFSPWRRKLQRRVRIGCVALGAAMWVFLPIIGFSVAFFWVVLPDELRFLLWDRVLEFSIATLAIIPGIRQIRRERRILRLVPEHDGLICPSCLKPLEVDEEGGIHCPRGHELSTRERLIVYWEQYGFGSADFAGEWSKRRMMRQPYEFQGPTFIERLGRFRFSIPITIALATVLALVIGLLQAGHLVGVLLWWLYTVPALLAGLFFWVGRKRRSGDSVHCASCDYERATGIDSRECPECGCDWSEPGSVIHGHITRNRAVALTGWALWVPVMAMLGFIIASGGFDVSRALSTSTLVRQVGRSAINVDDAWKELATRQLTEAQRLRLARDLLERRSKVSYFSATSGALWLETQVMSGLLPAELCERYHRERLEFELVGPKRARVGETITISATSVHRSSPMAPAWRTDCYAMVEGFRLDDSPEWIGRRDTPDPGIALDLSLVDDLEWFRARGGDRTPTFEFTPERSGLVRVHFAAELFVYGAGSGVDSRQIGRNEAGEPDLPPGVIWQERVELVHEIRVRD